MLLSDDNGSISEFYIDLNLFPLSINKTNISIENLNLPIDEDNKLSKVLLSSNRSSEALNYNLNLNLNMYTDQENSVDIF